ncbi:hypothetical protein SAMN06264364_108114 [Quadrisphaera granulorum]|uniref:Ribonuclease VapC n=1 Tax=Quadrisphaera granulorum TaxID=317664 RepID=A0A316AVS2_9ACTN|nr:type II toxin-antitoxin system VapC family toxin [Quadrisphaera granulorum]PWJ54207.1 hypothetical protein BXY45_108114 [Quadrisphaera granulorum]SZE96346.1 hypothetical protein SAMN06264364_108114 [Quadrisphaera granulorum]
MSTYADTSALAKLLVAEAESSQLADHLNAVVSAGGSISSSSLAETELRRLAVRRGVEQTRVTALLQRVDLAEPDRALFTEAGLLPDASLRSLDALHLATALRLSADVVVAYDVRLLAAATRLGLPTLSPGWETP